MGVSPAAAMDPKLQTSLAPAALALIHTTISSSLRWIFVIMLTVGVLQLLATLMMRRHKAPTTVNLNDALEAA